MLSLLYLQRKQQNLGAALTLACQGTATDKTDLREAAKPEPVSMGLIIDFTTNTVAAFDPGPSGEVSAQVGSG